MRIAVIFDNFGPYHLARLSAAARRFELLGIEVAAKSADYGWHPAEQVVEFERRVLLEGRSRVGVNRHNLAPRMRQALSTFRPQVVAIPGWSFLESVLAIQWCVENRVCAVLMSESQGIDERRTLLKEWIKRCFLRLCSAALVGGRSHMEYLVELGMAAERVFLGYDVVDNDYFAHAADAARSRGSDLRKDLGLPSSYFLASNRFIPKKNLAFLVRAYGRYRALCTPPRCDLVLLGDGPLRREIEELVANLGIGQNVHLPGFKQYNELPAYYGLAEAFVHASSTEQWGLVVNEAMASGLPVLVSHRCGCAAELVQHDHNGFQFDPFDEVGLADCLLKISQCPAKRRAMGLASRLKVDQWGTSRFSTGLQSAAEAALSYGVPTHRTFDRLLLWAMART